MDAPGNLEPLFETILKKFLHPSSEKDKPFKMLVSTRFDNYKGIRYRKSNPRDHKTRTIRPLIASSGKVGNV